MAIWPARGETPWDDKLKDYVDAGDTWEGVKAKPDVFPPSPHNHDNAYAPIAHSESRANPHEVTAAQVGAYNKEEVDTLIGAIDMVVDWAEVQNKPSAFPAAPHHHNDLYAPISHHHDEDYADIDHAHAWGDITGKPSTFTPSAHDHNAAYAPISHASATDNPHGVTAAQVGSYTKAETDAIFASGGSEILWDDVTGKPSSFPPAPHNHDADYADIAHSHAWGDITGKPSSYPPAPHHHDDDYADISHSHAWGDITGKPSTFTPSAHSHAITEVTGLQAALNAKFDDSQMSANGKGFVNHGSTASMARPTGFASVEWVGTVQPVNMVNGDTWVKVS